MFQAFKPHFKHITMLNLANVSSIQTAFKTIKREQLVQYDPHGNTNSVWLNVKRLSVKSFMAIIL